MTLGSIGIAALVLAGVSAGASDGPKAATGANLLEWDGGRPDGGWTPWSPRPELAPSFAVEAKGEGLRLAGAGRRFVHGGWRRSVSGLEPGRAYRLAVDVNAQGVVSLLRHVLAQIRWTGPGTGPEVAPEYAATGTSGLDGTFTAPGGATGAEVSLLLQWAPGAQVTFRRVRLREVAPPARRDVRVATLYWRPEGRHTPEQNVAALGALIDRAAATRPDVILLSEATTFIGTGLSVHVAAQEVPGPAFRALAARARRHRAYIIYGAYERADGVVYNSAFIVGRDGSLVGRYRKVQLPWGEVEAGLSPGDGFDTFDLDFGRVGVLICHDAAFDEPARIEVLKGAEILFVPAWGGDLTQLRARAMDNGVWLVTSGYDVPSAVIDPAGEVVVRTWKDEGDGTAAHTIDLASPVRRPWIGDWRRALVKQRRIEVYGRLLQE